MLVIVSSIVRIGISLRRLTVLFEGLFRQWVNSDSRGHPDADANFCRRCNVGSLVSVNLPRSSRKRFIVEMQSDRARCLVPGSI